MLKIKARVTPDTSTIIKGNMKLSTCIPCNETVTVFVALLVTACSCHQSCNAAKRGHFLLLTLQTWKTTKLLYQPIICGRILEKELCVVPICCNHIYRHTDIWVTQTFTLTWFTFVAIILLLLVLR